ncbi:outer membrane beta-barrel protein [Parafilimonas sp.]|uniref:outer membrane beta-barrel protein n=1 Tax=Parafilimonas sp. TaxID=1969739 RepID=UPI0039E6A743
MKYWLLAFGFFISSAVQAQFGFYMQAGGNATRLHVSRNPGGTVNGNTGYGWQASAGTEYHTQFGFLVFIEAGVSQEHFGKDSAGATTSKAIVSEYAYQPLFLNFPFGIGYQFPLSKQLALRVYAGATTQIGIGGKVCRKSIIYGEDSTGSEVITATENNSHKINFGRSIHLQNEFRSDIANAVWGLNAGVGLSVSQQFEITAIFQSTLTNMLPGGDGVTEIDKLQSVNIGLTYYFSRSYYHARPLFH